MPAASTDTSEHPINRVLAEMDAALEEVVGRATWSMTPEDERAALVALARHESRVAALRLAVVAQAQADDAGAQAGATSTAAWHADATGQTPTQTARMVRQAKKLEQHPPVVEALGAGSVRVDQAVVIIDAVDALPADLVDQQVREEARGALLGYATGEHALNAAELRRVGARILEAVAPEVAEEALRRKLEAEERRAAQRTRFTMSADGQGCVHGRFTLPAAAGAMLRRALEAIAAPKHQRATGGSVREASGERKARPLRLGEAFAEYVSRYSAEDLPQSGGTNATVVVTMTLETLLGAERAATLDTGEAISAGRARMLACEAGIIPFVLGGKSQVLDAGADRRFHTRIMRLVIQHEQRQCTARGCDWPPGMCHVHHWTPFSRGGPTNTRNAGLLCPRHHARAHDPAYTHTRHPDGSVTFHRRT